MDVDTGNVIVAEQMAAGDRRRDELAGGLYVVEQGSQPGVRPGAAALILDDELGECHAAMRHCLPPSGVSSLSIIRLLLID